MQPNAIDIAIQYNHDLQENSKKLKGRSVAQIGNVIEKKCLRGASCLLSSLCMRLACNPSCPRLLSILFHWKFYTSKSLSSYKYNRKVSRPSFLVLSSIPIITPIITFVDPWDLSHTLHSFPTVSSVSAISQLFLSYFKCFIVLLNFESEIKNRSHSLT